MQFSHTNAVLHRAKQPSFQLFSCSHTVCCYQADITSYCRPAVQIAAEYCDMQFTSLRYLQ
eukprot:10574-Heterococcus_DN1.PRE.4